MTRNGASRRKICFPITNRIHYARQKQLLGILKRHPKIDLQIVAGGSILLEKYAEQFLPAMEKAGYAVSEKLFNVIEGGTHIAMAKTAGLTALDFTNALHKLNPDIVLIRGDRFEQLAMAMVAAYLNKTVAHIEGGDISGTIDESVRHAITKLANVHFVTNEDSKKRVIRMGENPRSVFNVGSPDVEFASLAKQKPNYAFISSIGAGHALNFKEPYIMVLYHPVTTDHRNRLHVERLLRAVDSLNMQAIWFWPNNDAGTNEISKAIRVFRETGKLKNNKIRFVTDIVPEDFMGLLKEAKCIVGNSSSGIKEASYFGIPAVNIGSRQDGRLRGSNVLDIGNKEEEIRDAVAEQISRGKYKPSYVYYKPNTSKKIADVLSKVKLGAQKKFYE